MPEPVDVATLVPDDSVKQYPTASVWIEGERQRQNAEPDDALVDSINVRGLLQPIIIHEDGRLIAGERRWRAHIKLKKPYIRATILEGLPPLLAYQIELIENMARKQLSWQEETKAIATYHNWKLEIMPIWTQMGTANDLGISQGQVSKTLLVAAELENEDVASCPTFSGAFNLLTARAERAAIAAQSRGLDIGHAAASVVSPVQISADASKEDKTAALLAAMAQDRVHAVEQVDKGIALINAGKIATAALEKAREAEPVLNDIILCQDFLEWAESYAGPKFDVLHVDFPYGKGYSGSRTRKTGKSHIAPMYADDPDVYLGLVEGLLNTQDRFTFPAAHCLFWFDMSYYAWTIEMFEKAGWKLVQPFPFIWTKGYQGVAADPKRRPRHCYETALMFSRGDRKIVKLDKDHFDCGIDEKLHMNQKPLEMLKHFLSMFVDENTALLDPTCGSGMALVAAGHLKANRLLGIELDSSNAEVARHLLARHAPKPQEAPSAD